MRFSPLSFILGLAAASLVPVISRVFRPLAVEATAAGMGVLDDARRIVAEQMETLEDIVAEARARRESLPNLRPHLLLALLSLLVEETSDEPATPGPSRRRSGNGHARRRA